MANQTSITANKELVREFIDRVFNEQNAEATQDFFSPGVQWHGGSLGTIEGSDAMTGFYSDLFAALPDLHANTLVGCQGAGHPDLPPTGRTRQAVLSGDAARCRAQVPAFPRKRYAIACGVSAETVAHV